MFQQSRSFPQWIDEGRFIDGPNINEIRIFFNVLVFLSFSLFPIIHRDEVELASSFSLLLLLYWHIYSTELTKLLSNDEKSLRNFSRTSSTQSLFIPLPSNRYRLLSWVFFAPIVNRISSFLLKWKTKSRTIGVYSMILIVNRRFLLFISSSKSQSNDLMCFPEFRQRKK